MLRALVALLLVPSAAMAAAAPEKMGGPNRNFDARAELNQGFRAAPAPTQLQSVADFKRDVPDLGVTYDDATGATRSILNYVGFLTAPQAGRDAAAIGLEFVRANLALFGLSEADLADMDTTDTVYSAVSGSTYVYLRQRHEGLPLYNGQLHFGVSRDGRVLIVNNAFLPGLAAAVNATQPSIGAGDAVLSVAQHLGMEAATPQARGEAQGAQQTTVLDAPGFSLEPIEAKLMLLPIRRGEARLVWNFQVHTLDTQHVYDMTVDAVDGRVWTRIDWVASDTYKVYDRPVESPIHTTPPPPADARTSVLNPAHAIASPFGWHDTNGVVGAEFTIPRGNNVHAYEDSDNNNAPPANEAPYDCGVLLNCDFPIDLTMAPSAYRPAAVTNLFHWNNLIHDIQHRYGFDAPSGNFQVHQYGATGLGNDDVRAEAQDGGGTNNANFFTPVDGQRPRMQMYIGTNPTPDVDGDLDNLVIVHEYGHGISNRLVGGPNNVSCLGNAQQPGEGLSDWWGLFYTGEIGDTGPDRRTVGNYLFGQPVSGPGIRTQPYSTNPAINTWTYASIAGMAIPHGVGSVWAQGYWEAYWKLVDQWGFDIDLYNGTGNSGNQRAGLYINEGLKATMCSPTFLNVRDGIISAATATHGGEDVCRLWAAFAAYGMGIDAVSGGPSSTNPTNGFLLPIPCRPAGPTNLTATATAPNRITTTWTAAPGAVTYRVYRANGACPQPPASFVQIAAGITTTTYDDNTVSGGLTYAYVVTAVDGNGVESGFSNCDDAVATGGCTTPPTFAGLDSATSAGTPACAINLAWSAATPVCPGTTVKYNVYRSTTAGAPPSPATLLQSCLTTLNFTDTTVNSGTTYYYKVRAEDSQTIGTGACNNGIQDTNLVERSAVPAGPITTVTDDVESGGANWSTAGGMGTNPWSIVTTDSHSPTHSWFWPDPPVVTLQPLTRTSAFAYLAGGGTWSWWHIFNTEPGFDGYVAEYSLDGGTTWSDILLGQGTVPANPNRFIQNGYNATLSTGFQNPLPGRRAWAGQITAWQEVRVDMADFANRSVTVRWRAGSDNSVSDVGIWIDDISFSTAGSCSTVPAQAAAPEALAVDTGGNLVYQPNETVVVAPTWRNTGANAIALTGALTNHTGPPGPVYTIPDGAASYGTIAVGGTASCGSNCYSVANTTAVRPATHWDSTALETVTPTSATKTWVLHVGDSFTDVPASSGFYRFIETILHKNVTGGCTTTEYCPANSTTRAQMAVFVLVSKEPPGYAPPACVPGSEMFADVPASSGFCRWVEELARRGVVTGCGGGNYCPNNPATREQMAVFVLRTLDPALNPPPCVAGSEMFADVPASSPFCRWVEELARRGVVTGCGGGNYCPTAAVTRAQMSVFLAATFGLTLYGL